jgi:multicomponent Na+:H+ antiporter subunit C
MSLLPYIVSVWLFMVGIYGITTSRNLIHLIICLAVAQSSTYVLLLSIGYRTAATAPVFSDAPLGTPAVDPIVQALTLTDIIVGTTVSALLLALAVQAHKR